MDIQVATLCDAATDYGGKLNILGTFDTIMAPQLPALYPQCSIALRLAFSRIEEGRHKLRVNLVDEDGRSIMPSIDLSADIVFPPEGSSVCRNFIINIQHLKFERPGSYAIDIAVDGRYELRLPLHVRSLTSSAAPASGTS